MGPGVVRRRLLVGKWTKLSIEEAASIRRFCARKDAPLDGELIGELERGSAGSVGACSCSSCSMACAAGALDTTQKALDLYPEDYHI